MNVPTGYDEQRAGLSGLFSRDVTQFWWRVGGVLVIPNISAQNIKKVFALFWRDVLCAVKGRIAAQIHKSAPSKKKEKNSPKGEKNKKLTGQIQ